MKPSQALALTCILILVGTLAAGLWPFRAPRNQAGWLGHGLHLDRHGTVLSTGAFATAPGAAGAGRTIEIWLQSDHIWYKSTVLAFYRPGEPQQFSLHQFDGGLDFQTDLKSAIQQCDSVRVACLPRIFYQHCRRLVTITSGTQGTTAYVDGVFTKLFPRFQPGDKAFTGRLVLGNSPVENDSWSGLLLGLAIYNRELTGAQVRHHYESWTAKGQPDTGDDERTAAVYLFNEGSGNIVRNVAHDYGSSGGDLLIPEKYMVLDEKFLEPAWKEFDWTLSYGKNVLINIGGFIPLGFFFFAYLIARRTPAPMLITIALGATVSLIIEVLQAFLPTRDSGTTDLITNTLGTGLGVVFYRWKPGLIAQTLGRFPFRGA